MLRLRLGVVFTVCFLVMVVGVNAQETPTATSTPMPTETPTTPPTETLVPSPTDTDTPTATETLTETALPTVTATESETPAETPTATEEFTVVPTATPFDTPTETPTSEFFPSATPTFTETPTPEPLPTEPPLTLLYSDTFDTGELYTWTLGAGWSLVPSEGGQALQVTNSDEPVTFGYNNLANVAVQARFLMGTGLARISIRQSEAGSYSALIDPTGQVALYRGGQFLGSAVVSPVTPGQWRIVRLSAMDSVVRLAIDGVEVIAVQISVPLPLGTISFAGVGVDTLTVDDVFIWIPTADLPPTATPSETPSPTVTATFAPLPELTSVYSESFDGSRDPFSQLYLANWPLYPTGDNFALYLTGNKRLTRVTANGYTDVVMRARFLLQTGTAQLSIRQSDAGNYTATLDSAGQVALYRNDVLLGSATVADFTPSAWYILSVAAIGDNVRVAVNDVERIAVRDGEPLSAGMVTFAADNLGGGVMLVDDIQLWEPGSEAVVAAFAAESSGSAVAASSSVPTFLPSHINPNEQVLVSILGAIRKVDYYEASFNIGFTDFVEMPPDAGPLDFDGHIALSPVDSRIAYNCGPRDICVVNYYGTDTYRLTDDGLAAYDANAAWSPDATLLALRTDRVDPNSGLFVSGIWVFGDDGSNLRFIPGTEGGDYPTWSEYGLCYSKAGDGIFCIEQNQLEVCLLYGDGCDELDIQQVSSGELDAHPDLIVDVFGQDLIAYTTEAYRDGFLFDTGIGIRNLSTGNVFPVYGSPAPPGEDGAHFFSRPAWSPDGRRVAFYFWIGAGGFAFDYVGAVNIATFGDPAIFELPPGAVNIDWIMIPPPPPFSIPGRIAFVSQDVFGRDHIYTMVGNTQNVTQLTDSVSGEVDPALSPDGRYVAYAGYDTGFPEIYIKPVTDAFDNNANVRRLTNNNVYDFDPTWSPDGTRIAYASGNFDFPDLFVMNADGSGVPQQLTFDGGGQPSWSPVSNQLLFVSSITGDDEIYLMDVDNPSAPPIRLTNNPARDMNPVWSPDGTRIAFSSDRNGTLDIFVMNADGSGVESILSDGVQDDVDPAWSPDGTQIAFNSYYPSLENQELVSFQVFRDTSVTTGANLPSGARAKVLAQGIGGWVRVFASFPPLLIIDVNWGLLSQSGVCSAIVTTQTLNVRQGPGTSFAEVGQVTLGMQITVTGRNPIESTQGDWYFIENLNPTITGWVSGDFIDFDDDSCPTTLRISDENGQFPFVPTPDPNLTATCDVRVAAASAIVYGMQPGVVSDQDTIVSVDHYVRLGAKYPSQDPIWYRVLTQFVVVNGGNVYTNTIGWVNAADLDPIPQACLDNLFPVNAIAEDGRILVDVVIEKSILGDATRNLGDEVQFVVTVTNNQDRTIYSVVVQDSLPQGLEYIAANAPTNLQYEPVSGLWLLDPLESSEMLALSLTARVTVPLPSTFSVENFLMLFYRNTAVVDVYSDHLTTDPAQREASVQVQPVVCLVQHIEDNTVFTFRAPVRGNPRVLDRDITGLSTLIIDGYAIDPLTGILWMHSPQRDDIGTLIDNWAEVNTDRLNVLAMDSSGAIIGSKISLSADQAQIDNCLSIIPDRTAEFGPLPNVPFESTDGDSLPLFTTFPVGFGSICNGDIEFIYGLGISNPSLFTEPAEGETQEEIRAKVLRTYGNPGYHIGVDLFAPSGSNVYSVTDNGIVVGIGVVKNGVIIEQSAATWGSARIEENNLSGFSVIVRYRHLYVLYGHLLTIEPSIFVGAPVQNGDLIGTLGTFPGSNAHLHIEVRSFGTDFRNGPLVGDEALEQDANGLDNQFGILSYHTPTQATYLYDVIQFFQPSGVIDLENSNNSVDGLGVNIQVSASAFTFDQYVYRSDDITWGLCTRQYSVHENLYVIRLESGFWGFVYQRPNLTQPVDPIEVFASPQ